MFSYHLHRVRKLFGDFSCCHPTWPSGLDPALSDRQPRTDPDLPPLTAPPPQTRVVTQPVRQPDQIFTVTSVQVVPFTSVVVSTQLVRQFVTLTQTVDNTLTRTVSSTTVQRVPQVTTRTALRTSFTTRLVTRTQQLVQTAAREVVSTVVLPAAPQTVVNTQAVVVTSTVQGADQTITQVVTVNQPREVVTTRLVQRVVPSQVLVTKTVHGYCSGGGGGGGGGGGYGGASNAVTGGVSGGGVNGVGVGAAGYPAYKTG